MALWVFVSHVIFMVGVGTGGVIGFIGNGGPAVSAFMIVSGYAIASSLLHSRATYGQYMARRLIRIYPVFLIGLLFGAATSALYPPLLQAMGWADPADVARIATRVADEQTNGVAHWGAHLLMIHGAIPSRVLEQAPLSLNGAAWSLSLEMQFYIVAPMMVAVLARPASRPWGLVAIAAVAALGYVANRFYPSVPSFLPQSIGWFVIGILTAIYLPRLAHRTGLLLQVGFLLFVGSTLSREPEIFVPVGLWVGLMLICAIPNRVTRWARGLLSMKPLVLFGEVSYSFYLIHMPLLILWGVVLERYAGIRSPWVFGAALCAVAPLAIALSLGLWFGFEKPLNGWAKRRFSGTRLRPVDSVAGVEAPAALADTVA